MYYEIVEIVKVSNELQYGLEPKNTVRMFAGSTYRVTVEVVHDDCPIYISFICGSAHGVYHEQINYACGALGEDNANILQDVLERDLPGILKPRVKQEIAEKASEYLNSQNIETLVVNNKVNVKLNEDIVVDLSTRDTINLSEDE
jgi:hypothetical protein